MLDRLQRFGAGRPLAYVATATTALTLCSVALAASPKHGATYSAKVKGKSESLTVAKSGKSISNYSFAAAVTCSNRQLNKPSISLGKKGEPVLAVHNGTFSFRRHQKGKFAITDKNGKVTQTFRGTYRVSLAGTFTSAKAAKVTLRLKFSSKKLSCDSGAVHFTVRDAGQLYGGY